jgi:hypothetical protein
MNVVQLDNVGIAEPGMALDRAGGWDSEVLETESCREKIRCAVPIPGEAAVADRRDVGVLTCMLSYQHARVVAELA